MYRFSGDAQGGLSPLDRQTQTFSRYGRKFSSFLWSSMFISRELKINRGGVCLSGDILPKNEPYRLESISARIL